MGSIASVIDGVLANTTDTTAAVNSAGDGSNLNKDSFLQLLVAQMKYQDPLEPTSNTEYIAQYATFSQVEQLQNMAQTMDSSSAMQLVGKYVTVDVTTASGATTTVSGRVDYVERSGSKTLLYIDGVPYNYENLNTVWDSDYLEAYQAGSTWASAVTALPSPDQLTLDYKNSVEMLRKTYDGMTEYQRSYIGSSLVDILVAAEAKIAELEKIAAADKSKADKDESEDEPAESEAAEETQTE